MCLVLQRRRVLAVIRIQFNFLTTNAFSQRENFGELKDQFRKLAIDRTLWKMMKQGF